VEREMVGKEIRKEKRIKEIFLKKIKVKVRSRIKDNLVDLVEKNFLL